MTAPLSSEDLVKLVQRVFRPGADDKGLLIMADLPDARLADKPGWRVRREMAADWASRLSGERQSLGLDRVTMAWFRNAGSNNAELPATAVIGEAGWIPDDASELEERDAQPFADLFAAHSMVLAPTQLSATAPLKVATRNGGFRAAIMPGFLPEMIPALKLDYGEINRRVNLLKELCDVSERCIIITETDEGEHEFQLDLRHRSGHASGGLLPANGMAGNLPSGEAYIVPYEGEIQGEPSQTRGVLPVQLGEEVLVLEIEGNRVVKVQGDGPEARAEREHFEREPAYANIAELGLGVLVDFGLKPTGCILLDEKLGLHVAFGRSDHFGGMVGPDDFSCPSEVIHLDRVYIPETQPGVRVREVRMEKAGSVQTIMVDGVFSGVF